MSGPHNTLAHLNNHLFEQLERLNDEELNGKELEGELKRSRAVADVAKTIINNGRLVLDSQKFIDNKWSDDASIPRILIGDSDD